MIFFSINGEFQFIIFNSTTLQDKFFRPFEWIQNLLSTTSLKTLLACAIPSQPYRWDILFDFKIHRFLGLKSLYSDGLRTVSDRYEISPFSIIFELIGSEILACVLSKETTERFLETSRFCPCRPNSPNALWWHLVDWLFTARRKIPFIIEFLTICLRSESVFCLCFSIMRKPALLLKFI